MTFGLEIVFVILCLMLIFIITIQPSTGEGLASAFSGVGSESFFGTKLMSRVAKFTAILAFLMVTLAIYINYRVAHELLGK